VTVNLDDRGIHHDVFHIRIIRQRIKYSFENIRFPPIMEPPEGRAPVAERRWKIPH
jgi:hypothetical protein